ncbi:MAG TPA: dTMP kinase [Candidatus Polarisedimenticolaceae bacterium]|nr:dTMP kinase [Candidatus Polarisedimenticolaceae bacterium]
MALHDDTLASGSAGPGLTPVTQVDPRLLASTRPRGYFVTFEGIEGSGKTTQIARLAEKLQGADETVVVTREPGGTRVGRGLRAVLLGDEVLRLSPLSELLLYVADRAQHLHEIVEPALAAGTHVLCDRYLDATLAYQGYARGLDLDLIRRLHEHPPLDRRPDRTVLLDLDPELGLERARRRNDELRLERAEGRFEREPLDFHRRVRDGYLALAEAEPFRFRIIAGEGSAESVGARVDDLLSDLFPALDSDEPA